MELARFALNHMKEKAMKKLALIALVTLPAVAWAQVAAVPEPETLSLFAIGAVAFFLGRRGRK